MNTGDTFEPTVFIIDDDVEILNSLKWLFESVKLKVKTYDSAVKFLSTYNPDEACCIITDVRMPMLGGLQLIEKLNSSQCKVPIIVTTGHGDIPMAVKAMKMGAVDFLTKPFNDQYLLELVQSSVADYIANTRQKIEVKNKIVTLSHREKQLLDLIAIGKLNKQIAKELNISMSTVEFHRARLMKKMNAKNVVQLIKNYLDFDAKVGNE